MTGIPDVAVQIADKAMRLDAEYPEDRAEAAGTLARLAALEKVAEAARAYRKQPYAYSFGKLLDALDALSPTDGVKS